MGTNYVSNGVAGETRAGNVTNNVTIGPDGTTLYGTARKKAKLTLSAESLIGGSSAPATAIIGVISFVHVFKKNADEDVLQKLELPNDYEEGTDIIIHLEWSPSDTDTGSVKWDVDYNLVGDADLITAAPTALTATQAALGTALAKQTTVDLTITGTSIVKDTLIQLLVRRNGTAVGDTYNNDCYLLAFVMEYTKNTLGSDL